MLPLCPSGTVATQPATGVLVSPFVQAPHSQTEGRTRTHTHSAGILVSVLKHVGWSPHTFPRSIRTLLSHVPGLRVTAGDSQEVRVPPRSWKRVGGRAHLPPTRPRRQGRQAVQSRRPTRAGGVMRRVPGPYVPGGPLGMEAILGSRASSRSVAPSMLDWQWSAPRQQRRQPGSTQAWQVGRRPCPWLSGHPRRQGAGAVDWGV